MDFRQHILIQSKIEYDFDVGGGGLRNVAKAARKGGVLSRIGRWLFRRKPPKPPGVLTGSLKGLTQAERSIVQELLAQGKNVQIIPRGAGKTADFIIDGVITELKTLTQAGPNTLKNAIEKAAEQSPQAILVDARNVFNDATGRDPANNARPRQHWWSARTRYDMDSIWRSDVLGELWGWMQ